MSTVEGADEVTRNLERLAEDLYRRAYRAAEEIAALLESYAKANHPWKPDTGATDVSTRGTVVPSSPNIRADVLTVVLSAGMEYDVFLELAKQGRHAWLWPAIEANLSRIRQIFAEHLRL